MVIKKLNNVFHRHSRVLFGAFTIVIIVSFLGFLTPGTFGFGDMSSPEAVSMGTAYGEKVSYGQLRTVSRNFSVFNEVFTGRQLSRDLPMENIFYLACALRKAGAMGLTVSDKEVAALIRNTPLFAKDGKFDKTAYDTVLKNLRRSGITQEDLYEACRQQLLMDKLQNELSGGITVTDGEAQELYRRLNAEYAVRVLEFPAAKASGVKVTDAEVQKHFAANRSSYTIPGKVSALVIAFKYKDFRVAASKLATEKALKNYFERNIKEFETEKVKNPKYASVKNLVKVQFIEKNARELALKAAYDFDAAAYEKLSDVPAKEKEKVFRELADKAKLVVIEAGTAVFGAQKIGQINSAKLVENLANLPGSNVITDIVPENDTVYIGFCRSRVMPRPAELKEVASRVKADAQAAKAAAEALKKAGALYAQVIKAKPGTAGKILAKAKGFTTRNFSFSLMSKQPPEEFTTVALGVLNLNVGSFSAPVPSKKGAVIAQLVKRTSANMDDFTKQKDMYIMMCRNQKMSLAMQVLQEEFAANCRFTGEKQGN